MKTALLILAAGESKRMNGIKQLLPWKNTSLLGHAIAQALQAKASQVYVVLGANANTIAPTLAHCNIQIIENKNWKNGLGSSIAVGVQYIKETQEPYDAILITLADQPLIDAAYYNQLIAAYTEKKAKIIASQTNNKPCVPAMFDAQYFNQLSLLNQDQGAKEILVTAQKEVYRLPATANLIDLDTPSDYEQLFNNFGKE
ncbi:nucleotidyltransferase family protein [Flavobacterium nackdongense]|uniref:Nucleotidyltransferase family protein n=1 Tax=Flavobacterium nackdongense TaxID=2547394 RepID=A0A4P6Y695_9FLAO|nr:nucleotidyltransferase family protein [Flavobacterium nackdongense]QBN17836.1 nucleotidyltransferase family protein [Flavobacterium nackdongense]